MSAQSSLWCGTRNPVGKIGISAAIRRTILINTAIIFQEWAGRRAGLPGVLAVRFGVFQVSFDKLLTLHSEAACHAVHFFLTECRLHLPAAVGTGSAVDSGPHALRGFKDALVDLV